MMSPTSVWPSVIVALVAPLLHAYVSAQVLPVQPSSSDRVPETLSVSSSSGSATSSSLARLRPEPASLTLATLLVASLVELSAVPWPSV